MNTVLLLMVLIVSYGLFPRAAEADTLTPVYGMADGGTATTEANRRALGLTMYAGEVLTYFDDFTIMDGKHKQVTVQSGKTFQFPVTGRTKAAYHKAGNPITGQTPSQSQVTISIDDILYSDLFFPDVYEAIAHYPVRNEYAKQAAHVLAKTKDTAVMVHGLKAARSAATIAGVTQGGTQIVSDAFKVAAGGAADTAELALALFEAHFQAAQIFMEKNIPKPWFSAMRPQEYYGLIKGIQSNGFSMANKDFMFEPANLNTGSFGRLAGFEIVPTNLLPSTNLTATGDASGGTPGTHADIPTHTNGTLSCTKTIGLLWNPEAMATVILKGLQVKSDYRLEYLGDLLVAFYLLGHGVLRPECAIELSLDDLTVA